MRKLIQKVIGSIAWVFVFPFALMYLLWELLTEYRMDKAQRDFENSDYYKSLNHDKSVPCAKCGRLPDLWEEAFPHKICESCYDIWLDELDSKASQQPRAPGAG